MKIDWNIIEQRNFSGLEISTYRTESNGISEIFDLAIIFNSYDSRSLEYANLFSNKQFSNSLLLNFKSKKVIKRENYKKNLKELTRISNKVIEYSNSLDIFDYRNNINIILSLIPKEVIFNGAKWFIDITGIPNIYLLSLFKRFKKIFPSPELYLLNVSGDYQANDGKVHKHFSEGISRDIYIPYYEGEPNFSKPWNYIFLLGFEGERSLSILKKCDPDFCNVIVADPGYANNYKELALEQNECFLKELSLKDEDLSYIDVGKIINVYDKIGQIETNLKSEMNICIVPLGSKPHALGAGIYALIHPEVSIMYQIPQKYYLKEIKRGKYIWLYKIK